MYREINNLPFRKIYGLDFEYFGTDGEKPNIVCMVVQDLRSGDISRYWQDDLSTMSNPRLRRERMLLSLPFLLQQKYKAF